MSVHWREAPHPGGTVLAMTIDRASRLRPALPMTIIAAGDQVHLVCGEDVRYSIHAGSLAAPLADLLCNCDGRNPLDSLLHGLSGDHIDRAQELIARLCSERILVDGPIEAASVAGAYRLSVEGSSPIAERLHCPASALPSVAVFCQDTLDYHAAMDFNRRCLSMGAGPWLWVTTGPVNRGFVSPVFLRDAGPCLACLLRQFQRLSPVPELYNALTLHGERGGTFEPAGFPDGGLAILEQIVRWKVERLAHDPPAHAVFRLHVLELETMELTAHRVFRDPTCPECHDAPLA
jgi:bacteriocin biosynthesis cyclodehydratase domain-containing protein